MMDLSKNQKKVGERLFSIFGDVKLVNTQEIPMEHVQRVSINYISEGIHLYEASGNALVIKEFFNQSEPEMLAKIYQEDGSVTIRHGERRKIFSVLAGYVEIYLPRSFFGTLNIKCVSGKIEAGMRLRVNELSISNTSGKIALLKEVMAGNAVLSTVSGAIYAQKLCALASLSSTSGSIRVVQAEGKGDFKTVSGSIEAAYQAVTGDIALKSTSGRVKLGLPQGFSYYLDVSSISGSIHIPRIDKAEISKRHRSGSVGTDPQSAVRLSTVSGRIEVHQP